MRIAALLSGEVSAPAVHAQTFPLLRALRSRGHEVGLVVTVSLRRWLRPAGTAYALSLAREAAGGLLRVVPHPPGHCWPRVEGFLARRALRALRPDVVHARQARAAVLALGARSGAVLADLRGIRPEEFLLATEREEEDLSRGQRGKLARLRLEERTASKHAGAVVCVSECFRRRLTRVDGVFVIPNAAEPLAVAGPDERRALRRRFGLRDDEFGFVYSGSLAAWQFARETVRLFREIRNAMPRARLTLLVHDRAAGESLLREEEVAGTVESLPAAEAAAALRAFDAGFLLRRAHPVNAVACPVKFAEYLHAGLPVVATGGIGDVSETIRREGLGVVLPEPEGPEAARRVAENLPVVEGGRCRAFARERLTFERTSGEYETAFEHAAGTKRCGSA
ncbi:MAG: glycosyltransferase [Planctomycetes bacterium]|jgi:glycosyltransferase involved in cell wall biosynthesis|nr:glycosyltransferase [Planctomycetota bacterium]